VRPVGRLLISKVLETGDLSTVQRYRIDPRVFLRDPIEQSIFLTIQRHYYSREHFGEVPTPDMVKEIYPSYKHEPPDDSVASLCEQLKEQVAFLELEDMGNRMIEYATMPDFAISEARDRLARIAAWYTISRDTNLADSADALIESLEMVGNMEGMLGLQFPRKTFNKATMGIQKQDVIIFYGRPKNMKSWIVTLIAVWAYLTGNARVMFYTREMREDAILRRAASIICGVDYEALKTWTLDPILKDQVKQVLKHLKGDEKAIHAGSKKRKAFWVTNDSDDRELGGSIMSLQAKIEQYEPDLVIVDPIYRMRIPGSKRPDTDWHNIYQISRELKDTAQMFDIPIVATNQAKTAAEKTHGRNTDELAYGDAIIQDCDLAVRVMRGFNEDSNQWELKLVIPAGREVNINGIVVNAKPGFDFSEIRELTEEDFKTHRGSGGSSDSEKKKDKDPMAGKSRFGGNLRK